MPRLVLRFAAYSAAATALAAVGVILFARHEAIERAQSVVAMHTRYVAETILRDHLQPADLRGPVAGGRRTELDALVRREVLVPGALRVKLYGRDARVVYSNDHSLIGTIPDDRDEVREALRGETGVTLLDGDGGNGPDRKVLESYTPIRFGAGGRPVGVFELYEDYARVARTVRQEIVPLARSSPLRCSRSGSS
jgi:hypothetical protein